MGADPPEGTDCRRAQQEQDYEWVFRPSSETAEVLARQVTDPILSAEVVHS